MPSPMNIKTESPNGSESRCACGSLLARVGPDGVELKCRRCRRLVLIPWNTGLRWHDLDVSWDEPSAAPTQTPSGPRHRSQSPLPDLRIESGPRNSE